MPWIIWPRPLEFAQPELLPFAHCFQTLSLDINPVSFLGGERFWTEPFTSGSLAEIWPWLVVTENHYQLTAAWWNELVSLIPVPNGHISVNTVTSGTNWHSQPRDRELNREGNWTFLFAPAWVFEALWTGILYHHRFRGCFHSKWRFQTLQFSCRMIQHSQIGHLSIIRLILWFSSLEAELSDATSQYEWQIWCHISVWMEQSDVTSVLTGHFIICHLRLQGKSSNPFTMLHYSRT